MPSGRGEAAPAGLRRAPRPPPPLASTHHTRKATPRTSPIAPCTFVRVALLAFSLITIAGGGAAASPTEAARAECWTSGGVTACLGDIIIADRVP
jgi:hypothetical protein